MFKLKLYLVNAFFSSLIGMVVNISAMFIWGWRHFSIYGLLFSMTVGVIIGTVSMFFFLQITLRLKERPFIVFLSSFLVIAALNISGALIFGEVLIWLLALIVSEVLSFFLTHAWYRRITLYKEKLEQKKALNRYSLDKNSLDKYRKV
jgi:hypothetical protein